MSDIKRFEELLERRDSPTGLTVAEKEELSRLCEADPALRLEAQVMGQLRAWERRALPSEPELLVDQALRAAPQGPSYLKLVGEHVERPARRRSRRLALAALLIGGVSVAALATNELYSDDPPRVPASPPSSPAPSKQEDKPTLAPSDTPADERAPSDHPPRLGEQDGEQPAEGTPKETPAPPSIDALLGEARQATLTGNAAAAAAAYRRLRALHPSSSAAHTVLVSLGKLQLRQLGNPAGAERSFARYLQAGGPLTREAELGRIDALGALGRRSEEKQAIESFLAHSPDGPVADRLRKRQKSW